MAPAIKGLAPTLEEIKALVNTAQGREKADTVIKGGRLVNVYTAEVQDDTSVAIRGKRIAYVGKNIGPLIGPETQVIEAYGKILSPGFIDGHTHVMNYWTAESFMRSAMPGGTTTVITETMEMNFAAGYRGAVEFIKSIEDQPIKIFATVSPMVSISSNAFRRVYDPKALRKLLQRNIVIGLGETYWLPAVKGDERLLQIFAWTLEAGKLVEGHAAGASDGKLQAYISAGNSSDHEPINLEETLERLRLGVDVMVREGDIRKDLEEIAKISRQGIDLRRLSLCSDGMNPREMMEKGYMEAVVQKAIDAGFEPVTAIQMASLNAAQHFNLDDYLGGISPGKFADIVILPDLRNIKPELVISNGIAIARNGKLLVEPRPYRFPKWLKHTYSLSRPVEPQDLDLRVNSNKKMVKVRVVNMITPLVTNESLMELPVSNGRLEPRVDQDLLKVCVLDSKTGPEKHFTGLVKGFGLRKGAFATGSSWDIFAITVVGYEDNDMAMAANRVAELQGGAVLCEDGKIIAEFSLPIGNSISEEPPLTLAEKMSSVQRELVARGVKWPDGYLTLSTLATPAIPFLRVSEEGLFNIREGKLVPLIVES